MISPQLILTVLALACFIMAFINKPAVPVQLGWLGMFFYVLAGMIGR